MRKAVSKEIFQQAWVHIKVMTEHHGYSITLAKKKVCDLFNIPYPLDCGFQRVKEYRDWKKGFLAQKTKDRQWVK